MYNYLQTIIDNLKKLSNGYPVLIKDLNINGTIPYTGNNVGVGFSIGHIIGLSVEDALVNCIKSYINGYDEDDDDMMEITDIIGKLGFDIDEHISITPAHDNQPIHDLTMNYKGKNYKIQIKAVNIKNEGGNEMNDNIRNGADMGIVVIYKYNGSNVIIDNILMYVPDVNGTYDYISKIKFGKNKLALDRSKSFITVN